MLLVGCFLKTSEKKLTMDSDGGFRDLFPGRKFLIGLTISVISVSSSSSCDFKGAISLSVMLQTKTRDRLNHLRKTVCKGSMEHRLKQIQG